MNMENRHDLKVNGAMRLNGGKYEEVKVNGSLTMDGDLDSKSVGINGNMNLNGGVITGQTVVNGSFNITGDCACDTIKIAGTMKVFESCKAGMAKISGTLEIGKTFECENIRNYGLLRVNGNLNAENIESKGALNVGGLINCDTMKIEMFHRNNAKELGGEKISIKRHSSFSKVKDFFLSIMDMNDRTTRFEVDTIEADEIYIEYTTAKTVRGKNIQIGEGCDIGSVEYSGDYKSDPDSKIGKSEKIG